MVFFVFFGVSVGDALVGDDLRLEVGVVHPRLVDLVGVFTGVDMLIRVSDACGLKIFLECEDSKSGHIVVVFFSGVESYKLICPLVSHLMLFGVSKFVMEEIRWETSSAKYFSNRLAVEESLR